jgi:hypothetical protein
MSRFAGNVLLFNVTTSQCPVSAAGYFFGKTVRDALTFFKLTSKQ